jgi:hypothetical protein
MIEAWLRDKAEPHEWKRIKDGQEVPFPMRAWAGVARSDLKGILSGIFTSAREWRLWDGPNPCAGVTHVLSACAFPKCWD